MEKRVCELLEQILKELQAIRSSTESKTVNITFDSKRKEQIKEDKQQKGAHQ